MNDASCLSALETSSGEAFFPSDHAVLSEAIGLLNGLVDAHDYTASPAFLASVRGRSPSYVAMKARFESTPEKRAMHRQRLLAALGVLLTSDEAYLLIPLNRHTTLDLLRRLASTLANPL